MAAAAVVVVEIHTKETQESVDWLMGWLVALDTGNNNDNKLKRAHGRGQVWVVNIRLVPLTRGLRA